MIRPPVPKRRPFRAVVHVLIPTLLVFAAMAPNGRAADQAQGSRPNILFFAVDDLRPELGCYGQSHMITPNIDRMASGGVVCDRSYCMVAVCGASRASRMTGLRPRPDRCVGYTARADEDAPGVVTLNAHLLRHGYTTVSLGKVYHFREDDRDGWSEEPWRPQVPNYADPANARLHRRRNQELGRRGRGPAFEGIDVPDETYADGLIARRAVEELQQLSEAEAPFFLAVGFLKPHLPFVAPKRYWDLYDRESIQLPATYERPTDVPDAALHTSGELRAYAGIPAKGPLDEESARTLIHGYYACVSYTDAQIGLVLDALDRLGLADETIVVLWGDHGWNLGDHGLWCKHCTYETSMRAPLILRGPGVAEDRKVDDLIEFIDIYPTLCDLTGLSKPGHLAGTSLIPWIGVGSETERGGLMARTSAVGRYGRGDTVRTDRYRYSEYHDRNGAGRYQGRMLFDHQVDPLEQANLAERPELAPTVERLTRLLHQRWGRQPEPESRSTPTPSNTIKPGESQ